MNTRHQHGDHEHDSDDDVQMTLVSVRKCFIFRIPPLQSSQGYRAQDWPKDAIWTGRLRVVSTGSACQVLLEHTDKPGLFAVCVVNDSTIEPVVDSSRYFALTLSDGRGKKAVLGLGFGSREDAFDFKAGLAEFEKMQEAGRAAKMSQQAPPMDLSLKGSIKIGKSMQSPAKKHPSATGGTSADILSLVPPPKTTSVKRKKKKKKQKQKTDAHLADNTSHAGFDDQEFPDFGDFVTATDGNEWASFE